MNAFISEILKRGLEGKGITRAEAKQILEMNEQEIFDIIHVAGQITRKHLGNKINLCTIVNAKSGRCSEDCKFCAQSAHHDTDVDVYSLLSNEDLVEAAQKMDAEGVDRFGIVTSGKGIQTDEEIQRLCEVIREITKTTSLEVCASLGVLSPEHLLQLRDAGLISYHHNIETAPSYYSEICSTHPYELREKTVKDAKEAGLKVCCGGIIGLGETWEHRIEMAFAIRDIDPDSIPINVLNPVKGTALEDRPLTPPMEVLKTIALFRLINPTKSIRYAGGREVNMGELQSMGLIYGLDGMLTGNYLTTTGRVPKTDKKMIRDLGFE